MGSLQAPDFGELLARLSQALDAREIPFMLIGGQAVLVHGEPRLTQDVDVTLGVGPSRVGDVLAVCEAIPLTPLPPDIEGFVERTFVLPTRDEPSGIRVDLIFSTIPYEAEAIARAERLEVGGGLVPFATAEDLIIHKLFAGRPRDLEDARGVVRRKGGGLDWPYLRRWCDDFAEVPGREAMPSLLEVLREQV